MRNPVPNEKHRIPAELAGAFGLSLLLAGCGPPVFRHQALLPLDNESVVLGSEVVQNLSSTGPTSLSPIPSGPKSQEAVIADPWDGLAPSGSVIEERTSQTDVAEPSPTGLRAPGEWSAEEWTENERVLQEFVILASGDVQIAVALREYQAFVELDLHVFNRGNQSVKLSPDVFALLDHDKNLLRRLDAGEVPGLLVEGTVVMADTCQCGLCETQRDHHRRNSAQRAFQPFDTALEDLWADLVDPDSSAAVSLDSMAPWLAAIAHEPASYELGQGSQQIRHASLMSSAVVLPDSRVRAAVHWLPPKEDAYPLRLRVPTLDYEVLFARPKSSVFTAFGRGWR